METYNGRHDTVKWHEWADGVEKDLMYLRKFLFDMSSQFEDLANYLNIRYETGGRWVKYDE